ncbi:MAG: hypothetical protein A2808_02360 [Candidatus Moranbacteria bacterium RIFCSPHIGHO2_01_FULL_55_24]|nr:MAG: hypothetical protein A2808_02360 [Candidatus Moranbacteria bacterium RIFCSPHIGHO2_01_FULL_55_24]
MGHQLAKNILATVTYYDVLDYPLTSFEIWKHLVAHEGDGQEATWTLGEVVQSLEGELLQGKIAMRSGLYFSPGREALLSLRIQREKCSARKLVRMRRLARLISCLPYVRMIGATGSLAMKHGTRRSDWDMLIVFRAGKIWFGRTIVTLFLHAIGKRRHGKKITDRACLNYFITEDNLEIMTKDLYSAHEYRFLVPLFGIPTFRRFELSNAWIRKWKPEFAPTILSHRLTLPESRIQMKIQRALESISDFFALETWLARIQKAKIARNPNTALEGSLIEASDQALIFLPRPRGPKVFSLFKERMRF